MSQFLPFAKKDNIVVQELNSEVLIYNLADNKAFCLNETSAIIWQLCDGTKTVSEIGDAAGSKLPSKISDEVVWLAIDQLKKEDLISNEFTSIFEGMSRREVIRNVGFASMVALPIVASIVAPMSTNAQSTACGCTAPGDCVTMTSCPSTVNCNGAMQCAP